MIAIQISNVEAVPEVEKLTRIYLLMEENVTDSCSLVEPWILDVRQGSMDFLTTTICDQTGMLISFGVVNVIEATLDMIVVYENVHLGTTL